MFKKSRIAVLDAKTANRIAAGEVVERPASVIKELLENSIDAGATAIEVEIEAGGLKKIQVSDNGCGMDAKDARLAFVRHATSKIKTAEDLEAILSMGFRGEALASIGAVSRVSMRTRTSEMLGGTLVEIEGGRVLRVEPAGCPEGTSILVEDLFFNTPARLKYMKTTAGESAQINEIVGKLALACPEIKIRLFNQGKLIFTAGEPGLLHSFAAVYGVKTAAQMLPLAIEMEQTKVEGYCSKPSLSRGTRRNIDIFINNRYIKSSVLTAAVCDAYKTVLPNGRFPIAVIKITLPPNSVDINIHPAKTEVKILPEGTIFDLIRSAIRKALFNPEIIPGQPEQNMTKPTVLKQASDQATVVSPLKEKLESQGFIIPIQPEAEQAVRLPETRIPRTPKTVSERPSPSPEKAEASVLFPQKTKIPELLYKGFLPPVYLLWQGVEGLYIMDQHAAHEKILYEKFLSLLIGQKTEVQSLLLPVALRLSPAEAAAWQENQAVWQKLGFEIEKFREPDYLIRGVPAGLPGGKEAELVRDLLDRLVIRAGNWQEEDWYWAIASMAACGAAIKAGCFCGEKEALTLLHQLEQTENPYTCPHGRPTIICLTPKELAARFKRI